MPKEQPNPSTAVANVEAPAPGASLPAPVAEGVALSLSGGLVPVRKVEIINVPGLTNNDEDIGPPWIKIDQNTAEFVISGERMKDIYCVIFSRRDGRARFPKDEKGKAIIGRPICRSRDFIKGVGKPGGSCLRCMYKEWPDEGVKPDCSRTLELPMAVDFFGSPLGAVFSVKGDSIKPARTYWRNLQTKYPRNEWRVLTHITVATKKYQGTTDYYVPHFEEVPEKDFLQNANAIAVLAAVKAQLETSFNRLMSDVDADGSEWNDDAAEAAAAAEY